MLSLRGARSATKQSLPAVWSLIVSRQCRVLANESEEASMKRREFIAWVGGAAAASVSTPSPLTAQPDALGAYNKALGEFRAILAERRAQVDAKQPLPNLPGQDLYLARNKMMSTYKDLTDAVPARIGRPNKVGLPPAHFYAPRQ